MGWKIWSRFQTPANRKRLLLALFVTVLSITSVTCSSDNDGQAFRQVNPGTRTYSIADFESIGYKVVKEYDVEGLTGATGATYGFLRISGLEPQSYELRFYESHDDAVRLGTAFAEEVTGEDAVLTVSDMSWIEGQKEQRRQVDSFGGGGASALYGNYAIHSNVVMLCEGRGPEQSLEVCANLVNALDGQVSD